MEDSAPQADPESERAAAEIVRGLEMNGHGDQENSESRFVATPANRLHSPSSQSSAVTSPNESEELLRTEIKLMKEDAPPVSETVAGPLSTERTEMAPPHQRPSPDAPLSSTPTTKPNEGERLLAPGGNMITAFAPQFSSPVARSPTAEQALAASLDWRPSSSVPPSSIATVVRLRESGGLLAPESKLMTEVASQVSTPAAAPPPAGQVATAEAVDDFARAKSNGVDHNSQSADESVAARATSISGRDEEGAPAIPTYEELNGATKHVKTGEQNAAGVGRLDPSPSVSLPMALAVNANGTKTLIVQEVNRIHSVGNDHQERGSGGTEIAATPHEGPAQLAQGAKSDEEEKLVAAEVLENTMPTEASQRKHQPCGGSPHEASSRDDGVDVGPWVQDIESAWARTPVMHQPRSDVLVELREPWEEVDEVDSISDDDAPDRNHGAVAHDVTRGAMASPTPMEAELSWVRDMQQTEVESDASGQELCESDEETEVESDLEHRTDYEEQSKVDLSPSKPTVADSQRVAYQSKHGAADEQGAATGIDASTSPPKLLKAPGEKSGTAVKPSAPDMGMALALVEDSMNPAAATAEGYGQALTRQPVVSGATAASVAVPAATNSVTLAQAASPAQIQPVVHPSERPGAAGVRPRTAYAQQQAASCCSEMTQQRGGGPMLAAAAAAENTPLLSAVFTAMRTNFTPLPSVYDTASLRSVPSFPPANAFSVQGRHAGLVHHSPPFSAASIPPAALGGYTHSLFQHAVRGMTAGASVPATKDVKPSEVAQEKPAVRSAAISSIAPAPTSGKACKTSGKNGANGAEVISRDTPTCKNHASTDNVQVEAMLSALGAVAESSVKINSEATGSSGTVATSGTAATSETLLVDSTVSVAATPDDISIPRLAFHGAPTPSLTPSLSDNTSAPSSDGTLPSFTSPPKNERASGEGAPRSREPISAATDSSALTGVSSALRTDPIPPLSASRAVPTIQRVIPAAPVPASLAPTRKMQAASTASRSGSAAAATLPRRFSTRLASEQQSQEEIMQGLCMICLERLSDPAEGGSAKLLGLLDSCTHKYCHACILEWSKVTNKCPQCKARFHTIKAAKELRRGNSSYNGTAITVADKDQTYDFVDVRDVVVLDPGVRCHPGCFLRHSIDARLQRGWEFSVQCEQCSDWFHGLCVGFREEQALPDRWFCAGCGGQPYPTIIPSALPASAPGSARRTASGRAGGSGRASGGGRTSGRSRVRSRGQQAATQLSESLALPSPLPSTQEQGRGEVGSGPGSPLGGSRSTTASTAANTGSGEVDGRQMGVASSSTVGGTVTAAGAATPDNVAETDGIVSTAGPTPGSVQQQLVPLSTATSATLRSTSEAESRPMPPRLRIVVPNPQPSQPPPRPGRTVGQESLTVSASLSSSPLTMEAKSPSPPRATGRASPPDLTPLATTMVPSPVTPLPVSPADGISRGTSRSSRGKGRGGGRGNNRGRARRAESASSSGPVSETEGVRPLVLPEPPAPSLLDGLKACNTTDLCNICGFDTEPDNLIVYCGSCNMGVHQTCYGISEIPTKEWYCSPCAAGVHPSTLKCRFCPMKGGALKRCTDGRWGHILCAFWIPECCFIDPSKMEPIGSISTRGQAGGIEQFLPSFRFRMCYVCGTNDGCAIRCHRSGCKFHLHPMCGSTSGDIYMEIESQRPGGESVQLVARCPRHHKGKGSVAGVKLHSRTKSFVGKGTDPLGIYDATIQVTDPKRNGTLVLRGKVTWFDPVRSRYCIVESSSGEIGENGGCAHWIPAEKLLEAKAMALNRRHGTTFIVKALRSLSGEGEQGAMSTTTDAAMEEGQGGGAGAAEAKGSGRVKVEETETIGDGKGMESDVVGRDRTKKERTDQKEADDDHNDEVAEDPEATESEAELEEASQGSNARGRSGRRSPRTVLARRKSREMQDVALTEQTPQSPQAGEVASERAEQPCQENSSQDDNREQHAAEPASGSEGTPSELTEQKCKHQTEDDVENSMAAATARSPSPCEKQKQQQQQRGLLPAVLPPPEQTAENQPTSRYPRRMTRSRLHPEGTTSSSKRPRWALREPIAVIRGAATSDTSDGSSREDTAVAQAILLEEEAASSAKRPRSSLQENTTVAADGAATPDTTDGSCREHAAIARGTILEEGAASSAKRPRSAVQENITVTLDGAATPNTTDGSSGEDTAVARGTILEEEVAFSAKRPRSSLHENTAVTADGAATPDTSDGGSRDDTAAVQETILEVARASPAYRPEVADGIPTVIRNVATSELLADVDERGVGGENPGIPIAGVGGSAGESAAAPDTTQEDNTTTEMDPAVNPVISGKAMETPVAAQADNTASEMDPVIGEKAMAAPEAAQADNTASEMDPVIGGKAMAAPEAAQADNTASEMDPMTGGNAMAAPEAAQADDTASEMNPVLARKATAVPEAAQEDNTSPEMDPVIGGKAMAEPAAAQDDNTSPEMDPVIDGKATAALEAAQEDGVESEMDPMIGGKATVEPEAAQEGGKESGIGPAIDPVVSGKANGGGTGHGGEIAKEWEASNMPSGAFTMQAGWPGMELFGQVPVMRIRRVHVSGSEVFSTRGRKGGVATYFASAYAAAGFAAFETRSLGQPPRFSFQFEELEELKKSRESTEPELLHVGGPMMPESEDSVDMTTHGRKWAREDRRSNAEDQASGWGGNGNDSAEYGKQERDEEGKIKEDEKLSNGKETMPSSLLKCDTDAVRSRHQLEDGEVKTLSDDKTDVMPVSPPEDGTDSVFDMRLGDGEMDEKMELLGGSPNGQTVQKADSQTTEKAGGDYEGKADENSMEISSISSDSESFGMSDSEGSDSSCVEAGDRDDDGNDNDYDAPCADLAFADQDIHSRPVAVGSSEGRSCGVEKGEDAVEDNRSHAENTPHDPENLARDGVRDEQRGGDSSFAEAGVTEVAESNQMTLLQAGSAETGPSLPANATPVDRVSAGGRPPSDPRRAPSDPRRARSDRRRAAADPRRARSVQNVVSDSGNRDGLNDTWMQSSHTGGDGNATTAEESDVLVVSSVIRRPPTPPPPRPLDESTLALRRIVREQIESVLRPASQGTAERLADDEDALLVRVSAEIEEELFSRLFCRDVDRVEGERPYKAKYKQLLLSLGNVRNDRLALSVLRGTTTPADLATKDAVGLLKSLSSNLNILATPIAGRNRSGSTRGRGKGKGARGGCRGMIFLG